MVGSSSGFLSFVSFFQVPSALAADVLNGSQDRSAALARVWAHQRPDLLTARRWPDDAWSQAKEAV